MRARMIVAALVTAVGLAAPAAQTAQAATPARAAAPACEQNYFCIADATAVAKYLYRDPFSSPQYNKTADRGIPKATSATNSTRYAVRTRGASGATWCLFPGEKKNFTYGVIEFWVYPSSTCPPR
ncbi:hypothetical protein AB0M32_09485 [Streptomyces sp. NPDC051985]|uniref:hypothetical protein n=1 Tax=Streptomyces sp. NPDC051985 TaxID=3155807 RepID=UPI003424B0E6